MNPQAHTQTLPLVAPRRVLACGAFLKNRACLLDGTLVHWSCQHGDLNESSNRLALSASLDTLMAQASGPVQAMAHDLHPDFYSTALAHEWAQGLNIPAIGVQHHHAHLAVVAAEHGSAEPAIGWALDGFGLGSDGSAWGGELIWLESAMQASNWQRFGHLPLLAQPGGDLAAREPWRMAAAALHLQERNAEIVPHFAPIVGQAAAGMVATLLERQLNSPTTSSAGRWFDAAAGALGLSVRQSHEAQAAIALEQSASACLPPSLEGTEASLAGLPALVASLCDVDATNKKAVSEGAARFQAALSQGLAAQAIEQARVRGVSQVMLSGGCLHNRLLRSQLMAVLSQADLQVLMPLQADVGDAGLALGQAWVAACTNLGDN